MNVAAAITMPVSKVVFKALKPNGDAVHSDETAR
jgi:hypothetical protein